ncbi:rCG36983 [Rattus norvegicus]|uniref:RCG36983 n=1 Tax=Rattus norvegicus TaxID=10116 RepID=A6HTY6_RAT|nr:rCG36983 [Rattus norvegicus]
MNTDFVLLLRSTRSQK